MIGCFNHGLFNFIANEMIDSTFFKTKDKEVCDKTNIFVNHPCRCNTFCIILLSPKNFAFFVRWKSFHKFRQKKIKKQQIWTQKCTEFCSLFPNSHSEPWKVKTFLLGHLLLPLLTHLYTKPNTPTHYPQIPSHL